MTAPTTLRVAYATYAQDPADPDPDLDAVLVSGALREHGADCEPLRWDDPDVRWSDWDVVLIRSTWNYAADRVAFLDWAAAVSQSSLLLNPLDIVTWNTDKTYLRDLADSGVPTIPTWWCPPGDRPPDRRSMRNLTGVGGLDAAAWVAKPAVGAGARGALRFADDDEGWQRLHDHVASLHAQGQQVMVQPYLRAVDSSGEAAVVVIDGQVSHAVRKVAALTCGGHGDARGLTILTPAMHALVGRVREAMADRWDACVYARVDMVSTGAAEEDPAGRMVVMECELTEPLLFCYLAPAGAEALAAAVVRRAGKARRTR